MAPLTGTDGMQSPSLLAKTKQEKIERKKNRIKCLKLLIALFLLEIDNPREVGTQQSKPQRNRPTVPSASSFHQSIFLKINTLEELLEILEYEIITVRLKLITCNQLNS